MRDANRNPIKAGDRVYHWPTGIEGIVAGGVYKQPPDGCVLCVLHNHERVIWNLDDVQKCDDDTEYDDNSDVHDD